jgi:hypothetical protein
MAKKGKKKAVGTKTRRVYVQAGGRKRGRRKGHSLNSKVSKKTASAGAIIGAATVVVPTLVTAVQSRSAAPVMGAMNAATLIETGKRAVIGWVVGKVGGMAVDEFAKPARKPINKVLRMVKLG